MKGMNCNNLSDSSFQLYKFSIHYYDNRTNLIYYENKYVKLIELLID